MREFVDEFMHIYILHTYVFALFKTINNDHYIYHRQNCLHPQNKQNLRSSLLDDWISLHIDIIINIITIFIITIIIINYISHHYFRIEFYCSIFFGACLVAGQKSGDFDRWGSGGATGEAVEGRVCFFLLGRSWWCTAEI